jgi:hypothetical protein
MYADDVNLLGGNIDTVKKNRNFNWHKEGDGVEVNEEKTKYVLLYRHKNAGQKQDIKIANILWKCGTVQIFGK